MELFAASRQWATRPADERFNDIETAHAQSLHYAQNSAEKTDVNPASIRAQALDGEVKLVGKADRPVDLTHFAFGQLAARIGAPAGYLRGLPATLAAQNLNHGLVAAYGTVQNPAKDNQSINILAHSNGKQVIRAITSDRYERVWNHEVLERMLDFKQYGWDTPIAFEHANGAGWGKPNGTHEDSIYVSDHDMFTFLVNNNYRLTERGNNSGLGRGFFVSNSEVGAGSLKITTFMYRYICANHIVWGAKDVAKLSLRHVGDIRSKFKQFAATLTNYANTSASEDEAAILSAQTTMLGSDKDEVLDEVFKRLRGDLSQKVISRGYQLALENESTDGDPHSVWAVVQGITRASQESAFGDERVRIDNAAAKLLQAF
jgi:hypothetical protein